MCTYRCIVGDLVVQVNDLFVTFHLFCFNLSKLSHLFVTFSLFFSALLAQLPRADAQNLEAPLYIFFSRFAVSPI